MNTFNVGILLALAPAAFFFVPAFLFLAGRAAHRATRTDVGGPE